MDTYYSKVMIVSENPKIRMIQGDCIEAMAGMEDNAYDLSIVDPPYGLSIAKSGSIGRDAFLPKDWDSEIPSDKYFNQLMRVSRNQIIWGGNYFPALWDKGCRGFIYWNKLNHHSNRSDGELAWTSFDRLPRHFEYMWDGNRYGFKNSKKQGVGDPTIRIHPTQKPIALYKWLLTNYATEGDRILDTHGGSGSIAIACYDMGFDLDWHELDKDYYADAVHRFKEHKKQGQLFRPQPKPQPKQGELI